MSTRIIRLLSANVKCLQAIDIAPNGSAVVTIGGKNGAGKSSVLDSIMYALAGAAKIPPEPIRKGARRGKIRVDLDNGLTITRTFTTSGTQLTVEDASGELKSPQAVLDKLTGDLTFDPLAYQRKAAKEQAEILRRLAGVDTAELDRERARLYEQRTEASREAKRLDAQLAGAAMHADAPDAEVSVVALTERLDAMREEQASNERVRRDALAAVEAARVEHERLTNIDEKIERLRGELDLLQRLRCERVDAWASAAEKSVAADNARHNLTDPDPAPIREQIRTAEATNAKVRANRAHATLAWQAAEADLSAGNLTDQIRDIDERKAALLAAAKLPVTGLGFDGDGVTLDGVPLEQASQAQRLRVSVAMGLAMNPELRVLLVRDGSLLDDDSMRQLEEMAAEADAQIWLEVVGTGDGCQVVIEEGRVVRGELAAAPTDFAPGGEA